jgi:uncharacterized protein YjbJ (UPF0337 family)
VIDTSPFAPHLLLVKQVHPTVGVCKATILEGNAMNKDILKGKWLQVRGDVRNWWGKFTDDDVDQIQGDMEKFIGKLQERYGYGREQAEKELNGFLTMPDDRRKRTA